MIGSRLREERDRLKLSQDAFAALAGAKRRTLIDWEKGTTSPTGVQLSALHSHGVDLLYVLTGERSTDMLAARSTETTSESVTTLDVAATDSNGFVLVPRYEVQASAGGGTVVGSELIVDYLAFRKDWVSRIGLSNHRLALIEVHGDSMEPTLKNSDLVLVDLRTPEDPVDGIYVIQHRGNLFVKRLQYCINGDVSIRSDNPAYMPEDLKSEDAERLTIIGRVAWFGRQI